MQLCAGEWSFELLHLLPSVESSFQLLNVALCVELRQLDTLLCVFMHRLMRVFVSEGDLKLEDLGINNTLCCRRGQISPL